MIRGIFLFILVAIVPYIEGQRFATGACPTLPPLESFDKNKFFGHWIEVEKSPSVFDFIMRCLSVEYINSNDSNLNVIVKGTSLAGLPLTVKGDGIPHPGSKTGKFNVRFGFGVPFQGSEMTVIDTNYHEYMVIYSCTSSIIAGLYHTEYIWLLSRDGTLSNPTRQNIYENLDRLKINRIGLQLTERSTCPSNNTLITRESEQNLGEPTIVDTVPETPIASPVLVTDPSIVP